jgi:hypothetical protein
VQHIVSCVQAHQVSDALLAALGVHADPGAVRFRHAGEQAEIGAAKKLEVVQRVLDGHVVVPEARRPGILVVAGDGRTVLGEDHAQAPAPHQLAVGQMLRDHPDGPLAVGFGRGQKVGRHLDDQCSERRGCRPEHLERVAIAEQTENRLRVLRGFFNRRGNAVREN